MAPEPVSSVSVPRPPYVAKSINAATRGVLGQMLLAALGTAIIIGAFACAMRPAAAAMTCTMDNNARTICTGSATAPPAGKARSYQRAAPADANGNIVANLGGRCAACAGKPETRRAYCGCCLSDYLFGHVIERPNLKWAWTWAQVFRRTQAAPGMVAVSHAHVMLLVEHVGGTIWTVRSYNDIGGQSYILNRDVRGHVFVDPNSRTAAR